MSVISELMCGNGEKMTRAELTRHLIEMNSTLGKMQTRISELENKLDGGAVWYKVVEPTTKTWHSGYPCTKCGRY